MKLERLTIRGLGPFRDEAVIDLRALAGARVVAIVGPNGAGKSTLLELFPGALYRSCPTRGSLTGLATDRGAYVEAEVVNGQRYRIRHSVDAVSGKGEASVVDEDGAQLIGSAKVRSYDAWAAAHLPRPEVLYASSFAVQGKGGFLDLSPGERKAVLLRLLGIERLEVLAERAREHARATKEGLRVVEARLTDACAGAVDPGDAQAELDAARELAEIADDELDDARTALAAAQERKRSAEVERARASELALKRTELERRYAEAFHRRTDLDERQANNQGVIDQAETIRAAVGVAAEIAERLPSLRAQIAERQRAISAAESAAHRAEAQVEAADAREASEGQRVVRVRSRLVDAASVEQAAAALEGARAAVTARERAASDVEAELEALRGRSVAGAEERIGGLRHALEIVRDGRSHEPVFVATEALAGDDAAIEVARTLPGELRTAIQARDAVRGDLDAARRHLAAIEAVASRAKEMADARVELAAAEAAVDEASRACEEHAAAVADAYARAEQLRLGGPDAPDLAGLLAFEAELVAESARVEKTARLADPLARAEARLAEIRTQLVQARQEVDALDAELDALPVPGAVAPPPPTVVEERTVTEAEERTRKSHAAVALAEEALARARATAERTAGLDADRTRLDGELADWTRLSQDLGRDGLQAIEIDAAGPELTALVNDLLHECVSRRWTVSIETTRLSADGKRQLEGCEVRVLDTERGRDAAVETFSGGERVLLGEAVSLALSVLACRRAGVESPTLVRDESGAALDAVNGRAYVAMLRRAADLIGASQVLFVSHAPELQELADARIHVEDGRVRVEA